MNDAILGKLREMLAGAHYVNIVVRRDGKEKIYEGDFLKDLLRDNA